jgi:hypothetical protein
VNDQIRAAQRLQRFRAQQSMRIRNQSDFLRVFSSRVSRIFSS